MIKLLLGFLLLTLTLDAKIIEVEQLFNKTTVKVKEQKLSSQKSFYGNIQFDESRIYDVTTRFDGFITTLNANKQYAMIKKGAPLFSIYSEKIDSILQEAKIASKLNKSLYNSAIKKLTALGLDQKEIKRVLSSKRDQNPRIYANTHSLVMKKMINKGSFAKRGKTHLQLANIEKLWFIASVYQKDLGFIQANQQAKIRIDGLKKPITVKLDTIYPVIDEKKKSVEVRFIIDNADLKLYANMFGKVTISNEKRTMLTLPKTAVLNKGSKYYAFKPISQSEFEPVLIEVRRHSSNSYEILDGLQKGEEVINNALFLLDSDAVTNALYDDEDDDW